MAKKTGTIRVHQIAKELGVTSKDVVSKCSNEGISQVTNHMSTLSAGLAATIREWFSSAEKTDGGSAVQTAAPVDLDKARARAKRRAPKKPVETKVEVPVQAPPAVPPPPPIAPTPELVIPPAPEVEQEPVEIAASTSAPAPSSIDAAVSYTHLTLPTILLV